MRHMVTGYSSDNLNLNRIILLSRFIGEPLITGKDVYSIEDNLWQSSHKVCPSCVILKFVRLTSKIGTRDVKSASM